MTGNTVDEDFPEFVTERSTALLRTAWLLTAPSGGPAPSASTPGTCPAPVDLAVLGRAADYGAAPEKVTAVPLCRYDRSTFDLSQGRTVLRKGPVGGDPGTFAAAVRAAKGPRVFNPAGCTIVAPAGPPYPVDVVFLTDPGGRAGVMLLRLKCAQVWPEDPERKLAEAVDAVLGPPF